MTKPTTRLPEPTATDALVDPARNHPFDPADELSVAMAEGPAEPHPSAADKPVEDRWPIDPPPPGYQGEGVAVTGAEGTEFVPPGDAPPPPAPAPPPEDPTA